MDDIDAVEAEIQEFFDQHVAPEMSVAGAKAQSVAELRQKFVQGVLGQPRGLERMRAVRQMREQGI